MNKLTRINPTNRTDRLRSIAYENGQNPNNGLEGGYWVAKAYLETGEERFHNMRRAKIDGIMLDNYSIEVTPGELLVGRFSHDFTLTPEQEETSRLGREAIKYGGLLSGRHTASTGHRVLDYEKVLNQGIKAVLAEIDGYLAQIDYDRPDQTEKEIFYQSAKISLEAFCRFARRAGDRLTALAEQEQDAGQKAEYAAMAENFRAAPYEPCRTFYEALQMVWFIQFACHCIIGDTSLSGRPDNYLYPFYRRDIENGVLTKDFARELIENFYLKHNEIYNTWPASLMVGGVDKAGNPVWNELSEMFIDAIEATGLINPSVSVAYTQDMPDALLARCVDILGKGYTKPSIFNDRVVQEGLIDAGVSPEDARYYIHSTCVEITPIGSSNILVASPYINPTKALEYVLGKGTALFGTECGLAGEVPVSDDNLKTFDDFYGTVKKVFAEIIRYNIRIDCYETVRRKRYQSSPFASALLDDCLAKGLDAGAGGAKYNFIYPCFPGYVTLVDSLSAIKTAVYDKKVLTLEKLAELCRNDFKNEDMLRLYLINQCEKFGNGLDEVDKIAKELYDFIRTELARYRHSLDHTNTFHPSYFAWIMHGHLGKGTAATPDGRRQGEALSENLGASQGRDKNTPLGVVNSIAKLDQKYGIGGIATNFRFSKSMMNSPEGKKAVKDFIRTFMDLNCFEVQINSVDQNTLLEAKKNPEKYATLMVRVAGYSDYFTNLAPEIQDEIIRRTEHNGF
jgi:formate C-acetyltransferase